MVLCVRERASTVAEWIGIGECELASCFGVSFLTSLFLLPLHMGSKMVILSEEMETCRSEKEGQCGEKDDHFRYTSNFERRKFGICLHTRKFTTCRDRREISASSPSMLRWC